VAVVCALLLVASLGVLTYAVDRLRDTDRQDAAVQAAVDNSAEAAEREAALEAARGFFMTANNYSVEDLPAYNERVLPLLTSGFAKQFKAATRKILGQLKETKLTARGRYVVGAVETIDADSAAVLVAGNARSTSTLVRRVYYPRWRVSLVKEGESWLVENYTERSDAGLAFQP
jgi:hypothetical protein